VRKNDWLGVVAPKEYDAIQASLMVDAKWSDWKELPSSGNLPSALRKLPRFNPPVDDPGMLGAPGVQAVAVNPNPQNIGNADAAIAGAAKKISASYFAPYHSHGSIGPSAAVAMWQGNQLTVFSSTQTVYGTRQALARFFGLPNNNVRIISVEGSGCYGMNCNDDVALDAALMSQLAGAPVRVQLMRWDETGWDNYDPARVYDMSGAVDASGKILAWKVESWGFRSLRRPEYPEPLHGGEPGTLVSAQLAGWTGASSQQGTSTGPTSVTGSYTVPNAFVVTNDLGPSTARKGSLRIPSSSLRTTSGFKNTFATESFVDELAALAGTDPLQFRLNHVTNARAIAVLQAAAEKARWQFRPGPNPDRGKNGVLTGRGISLSGTVAEIFEVTVDPKTGKVSVPRITVALDAGQHVNPDEIENQIEGAVTMGISRAIREEITFNRSTVTSRDWVTYPILRFTEAPQEINIVLLPHQDLPSSGVGEAPHGGVLAGVANAFFDATGVRMRTAPLSAPRVRAALKAAGVA
jgi:CO/xanthine dehydrogenase Mo-binding subunit